MCTYSVFICIYTKIHIVYIYTHSIFSGTRYCRECVYTYVYCIRHVWCSVLQCVAVCCSVVQRGAAWYSVVQCVAVAVCCSCSVLQCVFTLDPNRHHVFATATHCNTLQHTATHCNTLRYYWNAAYLMDSRHVSMGLQWDKGRIHVDLNRRFIETPPWG